jgi:hypothetical protein
MTTLKKGISAAPNRRVAAVATALWAVSRQPESASNTYRPQAGGYKMNESLIARQV